MMKRPTQLPGLITIILIPLLLNGCSALKPKPDPSRYYVLGNGGAQSESSHRDCARRVLVGPVRVAGHLDDPRIARRVGLNEISYSNWNFWAEPLARAFPRELTFSLETAMPGVCFFDFRKTSPRQGDMSLEIAVDQFEMTGDGRAVATVNWTVSTVGETNMHQGSVRLSRNVDVNEDQMSAGILALNQVLDEVARAIVADAK